MSSEATPLFSLALQYRRGKADATSLKQVRVASFAPFLRCMVGADDSVKEMARLAKSLEASPQELRQAGYLLLMEWLARPEIGHYEVLGLATTATPDEIRQHYRWLIRLFHPDRFPAGGDNYSARINEAYRVLKNSRLKREYDRSMAARQERRSRAARRRRQRARATSRTEWAAPPPKTLRGRLLDKLSRMPGWRRHSRAIVWSTVGLVLLAAVTYRLAPDREPRLSAEPAMTLDEAGERGGSLQDKEASMLAALLVGKGRDKKLPEPDKSRQEKPKGPPGINIGSVAPASRGGTIGFDGTHLSAETERLFKTGDSSPADSVPTPVALLLLQFIDAYEAGDLERLLRLFALDAQSAEGIGLEPLARGFGALFEHTQGRNLRAVETAFYFIEGGGYLIHTHLGAELLLSDPRGGQRYAGPLQLRVRFSGGRWLISHLVHQVVRQEQAESQQESDGRPDDLALGDES